MSFFTNETSRFLTTVSAMWYNAGLNHTTVDNLLFILCNALLLVLTTAKIQQLGHSFISSQTRHKSACAFIQPVLWSLACLPIGHLLIDYLFIDQFEMTRVMMANDGIRFLALSFITVIVIFFGRNRDSFGLNSPIDIFVLLIFNAVYLVLLIKPWTEDSKEAEIIVMKTGFAGAVYVCALLTCTVHFWGFPLTYAFSALTEFKLSKIIEVWHQIKQIYPYVWPKGHYGLQLRIVLTALVIAFVRVTNVIVPKFSKRIIDSLTINTANMTLTFRWDLIVCFVGLKVLQHEVASIMRNVLWQPVSQYTSREIRVKFFSHMHSLSLRWHLSRKTGEVLRIMDRGTSSIEDLVWSGLFTLIPIIFDIGTSIVYFSTGFNGWFGVIVLVTLISYFGVTVLGTQWRNKYRKKANKRSNDFESKAVDSLLNFETVKYYNAEEYETNRYKMSIIEHESSERKANRMSHLANFLQTLVINGSHLAGSLLCAHMVVRGENNFAVGDYVLFGTYLHQLFGPLHSLGWAYRSIQNSYVNMQTMFEMLSEPEEVKDTHNAPALVVKKGRLEFKNVSFHYLPEKQIIKNVSFVVEPGRTAALVGPSGAGKSTVLRLLFRFYDPTSGAIFCDGQDIAKVQQKSLRKHIGVVPQDTVLFNDTIRYNIRYGKLDATDTEVEMAAQAAEMHERILSFPDKYETTVGERGLKLSGGEKQRVAIARTILKAPSFILLDEIQASLNKICKGRTTVIIAHRLSTIIHADEILVLKEGEIVERGRHEDLLQMKGAYADMWNQQLQRAEAFEILDKTAAMASNRRTSRLLSQLSQVDNPVDPE